MTNKAEGALKCKGQNYCEMVNRASTLLSLQLRKIQSSRIVPKIKHPATNSELMHMQEIASAFADDYRDLYKA